MPRHALLLLTTSAIMASTVDPQEHRKQCDASWEPYPERTRTYAVPPSRDRVPTKHAASLTRRELQTLHEGAGAVPVLLKGAVDHWPAVKQPLSREQLLKMVGNSWRHVQITSMQGHIYDGFDDDLSMFLEKGLDMSHHRWAGAATTHHTNRDIYSILSFSERFPGSVHHKLQCAVG